MMFSLQQLSQAFLLFPLAECLPALASRQNSTGPGLYTLSAYAPNNPVYDALKVEYGGNLNLFQNQTSSYCPTSVVSSCPNGTDTVFSGTFYPSSEVPGGQEFYVDADGSTHITVQHSHSFPPGSIPYYYGWTWHSFDPASVRPNPVCPFSNSTYNCGPRSGYFTFQAPNGPANYTGGLKACPNQYNPAVTSVFAVTPTFNLTGCVDLDGLATHDYLGVNPPVWSY